MNFNKLLKKQLELDELIKKTHKIKSEDKENIFNSRIIALYVEIAEFANEVKSFKYWQKNKKISNKLILEEFSDCLHFYFSFLLEFSSSHIIEPIIKSNEINLQFILIFKSISKLQEDFTLDNVLSSIGLFLGVASLLKLDEKEIKKAYLEKNKINFQRIFNNY